MWTGNVKTEKILERWHERTLLIDLEKTRLVFVENEDAASNIAPAAIHSEVATTRHTPQDVASVSFLRSEHIEIDQAWSSIDQNPFAQPSKSFSLQSRISANV